MKGAIGSYVKAASEGVPAARKHLAGVFSEEFATPSGWRNMLDNMPGCSTVSAWPMSEDFRYLKTWLVWRRGTVSRSLSMFVKLLEEGRAT